MICAGGGFGNVSDWGSENRQVLNFNNKILFFKKSTRDHHYVTSHSVSSSVNTLISLRNLVFQKTNPNSRNMRSNAIKSVSSYEGGFECVSSGVQHLSRFQNYISNKNSAIEGNGMARFANGWIKIHRKIIETDIGSNQFVLGLWVKLLLMANYKETTINWRGSPRVLQPGEMVTSFTEISGGLCDRRTIAKWINYLCSRKSLVVEKAPLGSHHGVILKIVNYKQYQSIDTSRPHEYVHEDVHEYVHEDVHVLRIKENKNKKTPTKYEYTEEFLSFWFKYPKKVGKQNAFKEFKKNVTQDEIQNLLKAVANYRLETPEITFMKYPENFLKNGFWKDFVEPRATSSVLKQAVDL